MGWNFPPRPSAGIATRLLFFFGQVAACFVVPSVAVWRPGLDIRACVRAAYA